MLEALARNWWLLVLRGVVGVLFGMVALFYPAITLAVLVILFGAFALADGLFAVFAAVANRREEPRWTSLLLSGIIGLIIGIVTFFWPGITALALLFLIAAWAMIIGVGEIVAAIRLRKVIRGEWFLLIAGILSVLFGIVLLLFPGVGALAVVLWIGLWAIVVGVMRIAAGFRLRRWVRDGEASG